MGGWSNAKRLDVNCANHSGCPQSLGRGRARCMCVVVSVELVGGAGTELCWPWKPGLWPQVCGSAVQLRVGHTFVFVSLLWCAHWDAIQMNDSVCEQ